MLANDPKRLRFLGIDLHSRQRRRAAVVFTYLGYFFGMAILGFLFEGGQTLWTEYLSMFAWTSTVVYFGLFRTRGPVKRMNERPNVYRDMVLLRGLDDRSRYIYGGRFETLSPEQQHEVLMKYRVGNYLFPAKNQHPGFDPEQPDERELAERNQAYTRTLQVMTAFLASLSGVMVSRAVDHRPPGDMPSLFLTLTLAASTLPKAVILWNEEDPRQSLGLDEQADQPEQQASL